MKGSGLAFTLGHCYVSSPPILGAQHIPKHKLLLHKKVHMGHILSRNTVVHSSSSYLQLEVGKGLEKYITTWGLSDDEPPMSNVEMASLVVALPLLFPHFPPDHLSPYHSHHPYLRPTSQVFIVKHPVIRPIFSIRQCCSPHIWQGKEDFLW